ncbi:hypothetical protein E3N88_04450 [Mikania micrantha]|uniref:Uncharacterized protein n=1 Tax=Mikania micrantha TaxID=192012 RepID=A0A5N6PV13_9ASTR|nr:hypothetical protein E3N88_04450 [Mikania micrantha]
MDKLEGLMNLLYTHLVTPFQKRDMKTITAVFVAVLLVASELPHGLTFSSTTPAFLWSNIQDGGTPNKAIEAVNYQTLSPKDLAKSVMSEGGWSNLLCSNQKPEESADLAIVFVGREPVDISRRKNEDQTLVDLLKVSFTKSTSSLAYPYVSASEENQTLQNSLVSEMAETCGLDAKIGVLESCAVEGGNFEKLADISSVHEYISSTMEKKSNGQTPLVVFCNERAESLKPRSEGGTGSSNPGLGFDFSKKPELPVPIVSGMTTSGSGYQVWFWN